MVEAHVGEGVSEALGAAVAPVGMAQYAWLIPILTVASFVLVSGFGRKLWEGGAPIAIAGVGAAMILSLLTVLEVFTAGNPPLPWAVELRWLEVGGLHFDVGIYIDHFTAVMLFVVSILCFLIVLYSSGYMHGDPGVRRYYAEITLFITGMLGLVLANDFLLLFIFWEIMGLCSYLLIGFWYEKPEAAAAAKKAFLVTRVGDVFLFLGLVLLATTFGTTNMRELFHMAELWHAGMGPFVGQEGIIGAAVLLFFGGAVGKSAQFPLHVWLPDAMEGPTTVSALIHAATMVKAGVYLVARAYPLFAIAPFSLEVVAVVGGFTAFFAATMALANYDIKRVLAYSTLSQLAYMFLALGIVGTVAGSGELAFLGFTAAIFHLTTHAFTKALLFLSAGSVIHGAHTNDMRQMGGLRKHMPVTSMCMLVGSLSLAGFPGLAVFWSKDEILHAAFEAGSHSSLYMVLFLLGFATALMTAFYMFRLWFMTFMGDYRGGHHPHESPRSMTLVLVVLAGFAALWGIAMMLLGFGDVVYFGHPHHAGIVESITNPVALASILAAFAGIGLAYMLYVKGSPSPANIAGAGAGAAMHRLLNERYHIDKAYDYVAGKAFVALADLTDWFDRNVIDGLVNGAAWLHLRGSDLGRRTQSGNVSDYATLILMGTVVVVFLSFYLLNPNSRLNPWNLLGGVLGGA